MSAERPRYSSHNPSRNRQCNQSRTPRNQFATAIEVPRGAIVEMLVERGFHVFAINPKQLDRFRDRHTVAGAKDDRRDAFVLADSLRTDRPSFRQVQVEEPHLLMLRELSRTEKLCSPSSDVRRTNCVISCIAFTHRCSSCVLRPDEPWLWDLLELAPTPVHAACLTEAHVSGVLKTHRICRVSAVDVLALIHARRYQWRQGRLKPPVPIVPCYCVHPGACRPAADVCTPDREPAEHARYGRGSHRKPVRRAIIRSLLESVGRLRPGCLPKRPGRWPSAITRCYELKAAWRLSRSKAGNAVRW